MTVRPAALMVGASARLVFPVTAFVSAALVFTVEPMIGRMALPLLGGSAGVWAASLVFFQAALLVGYVYAHLLARAARLRTQVIVHIAVLATAALCLPISLTGLFGAPWTTSPALWLLVVLTFSVGPPFAALSATAPLIQVWLSRGRGEEGAVPWSLYAASNMGSLIALLAYPTIVEPLSGLRSQSVTWSLAYGGFALLIAAAGALVWREAGWPPSAPARSPSTVAWMDRVRWAALSALPSALLIGVTNAVTSDVGSAPFLWVAPLALYLLTFVIAFRARGPFAPEAVLLVQALALVTACLLMHALPSLFPLWLAVHFAAFFLTALVCHQALVARRPPVSGLTDFYFCLSLGGVLGGVASALIAPAVFRTVVEYPAALALSGLARPWSFKSRKWSWPWFALAGCAALMTLAVTINHPLPAVSRWTEAIPFSSRGLIILGLAEAAAILALCLRDRGPLFAIAALILIVGNDEARNRMDILGHWRGFYGVLRESRIFSPGLGEIHTLANGTTLHGAEAVAPQFRCQPLVYYAHETPIGQVMDNEARAKPALQVGVVGLGAGTLTAYARPSDRFTVFEINPLVVRIARDTRRFAYLSVCARGPTNIVLGDARRRLLTQPDGRFDTLIVDAFSSDSVPSHLLTVEAVKLYLSKIKPDGVVLLHLSNRNLDLIRPALADGIAVGAITRVQRHLSDPHLPAFWESSEDAVILSRTQAGAALFAGDLRWRSELPEGVAPWTDDHIDLFGALMRRLQGLR